MFITLLMRNLQMAYRTLRSVALRPFAIVKYKIASMTNISKLLNKIPKFFAALLAKVKMRPEKREDFVDAGPVFIAKSLLVILTVIIIAGPLFVYHFAWPWFVGKALTAQFHVSEPRLADYNGKVRIYYDEEKEQLKFAGRLEDGLAVGHGEEFEETGALKYAGNFAAGKYDGTGELYFGDGTVYKGEFSQGKRSGQGRLFDGDVLVSEGTYAEGCLEGEGVAYHPNGKEKYRGAFQGDLYAGKGLLFNEKGVKIYEGDFATGLFNGAGRYYDDSGALVYAGSFLNGLYDGAGKLTVVRDSLWYEGDFLAGQASGEGKLFKNNQLYYEGGFQENMLSGTGTLTDIRTGLTYSGSFAGNDIAYGVLFTMPAADIYAAFPKGLAEDTSREDFFFLYNRKFGLVLKFTYAGETEEARLVTAYRLLRKENVLLTGEPEQWEPPGSYEKGEEGSGRPDGNAAGFLGIDRSVMNYYQAIYEGYGVCCWIEPETEKVVVLEYYPVLGPQDEAQGEKESSSEAGAGDARPAGYDMVYFQELGLNKADFVSLGFN